MHFTIQATVGGRHVAVGHADSLPKALEEFKRELRKHQEFLRQQQQSAESAQAAVA
jgi:hypothetical protein